MKEEDTMRDECIGNIQRYAGMIQTKSRELKKRQEPRLLLEEIIKLAQEVQKECSRFPLPY